MKVWIKDGMIMAKRYTGRSIYNYKGTRTKEHFWKGKKGKKVYIIGI